MGQITTGIECCMRYDDISTKEAIAKFKEMAEASWNNINERILRPTPVFMKFLSRILRLDRIVKFTYI